MTRVAVKPELLQWALERSGLTADELLSRFPKLESWQAGEIQPTLKQLERFASATHTPIGYLFLAEPPDEQLPIPDFRTVRDAPMRGPSPNLLDTIYAMQRRQSWMRGFLIEEGAEPLPFIGAITSKAKEKWVAAGIRETLGMSDGWASKHKTWTDALRALRSAIESAGILMVVNGIVGNNTHRALNPDEFRGFVLVDEYAPLIFVNGADAKAAQMFTLAHELAHLWIGQDGVFNLRDMQPSDHAVEKFCNRVAAEFLIPEAEFRRDWPAVRRNNLPFQELARIFKVSPIVAARRALDLDLITKSAFFRFYNAYQEDQRRKEVRQSSGGDFYASQDLRVGRRFARAVMNAARDERLLFRDAYDLTGLHGGTFDRYAREIGLRV